MTESEKNAKIQPKKGEESSHAGREEVYLYKDSGIQERHGKIPIWLQLVTYGLLIWGVYYTIKYW